MEAFHSHMTPQSKNTEVKQQPDLLGLKTLKSHNQLKNLGLNPFFFDKKGGNTSTCILFFKRLLLSAPVILTCHCRNYWNVGHMTNFEIIQKV